MEVQFPLGWLKSWGSFMALVVLWEVAAHIGWVDETIFPAPSQIVVTLYNGLFHAPFVVLVSVANTLLRLLISCCIGIILGTVFGFLSGLNRYVAAALDQIVAVLMVIPPVVTLPVIVLSVGNGTNAILITSVLASILPSYIGAEQGIKALDERVLWVAKTVHLSGFSLFSKVLLPSALLRLIPAYKMAVGYAWRATIAAEILTMAGPGLGVLSFQGRQFGDYTVTYAAIGATALLGLVINKALFSTLEQRTLRKWGIMS